MRDKINSQPISANDFSPEIILEDHKVKLVPVSESHFDGYSKFITKPEIWNFAVFKISSTQDVKNFIDRCLRERAEKKRYSFTVFNKLDGQICGGSSFLNFSFYDKRVEIGSSFLNPDVLGKGINSSVKFLLLEYVFTVLNFERVEFKTDYYNYRAKAALVKIGAVEEGILKSHTLMHDGRRRDSVYYGIVKSAFESVKKLYKVSGG